MVTEVIRELMILGRERRPRLHKTMTAITEIKAVHLLATLHDMNGR